MRGVVPCHACATAFVCLHKHVFMVVHAACLLCMTVCHCVFEFDLNTTWRVPLTAASTPRLAKKAGRRLPMHWRSTARCTRSCKQGLGAFYGCPCPHCVWLCWQCWLLLTQNHTQTHTHALTHSHTHTHTHSLTHTRTHSPTKTRAHLHLKTNVQPGVQ